MFGDLRMRASTWEFLFPGLARDPRQDTEEFLGFQARSRSGMQNVASELALLLEPRGRRLQGSGDLSSVGRQSFHPMRRDAGFSALELAWGWV